MYAIIGFDIDGNDHIETAWVTNNEVYDDYEEALTKMKEYAKVDFGLDESFFDEEEEIIQNADHTKGFYLTLLHRA